MMMMAPVYSGRPFEVWLPEDNNRNTVVDDQFKAVSVRWPSGLDVTYAYLRVIGLTGDAIIPPGLNDNNISDPQVIGAMLRAVETWGGEGGPAFSSGVLPADLLPPNPSDPARLPPFRPAVDGYNLISFISDETNGGDEFAAVTPLVFFIRDFDVTENFVTSGFGVPPDFLNAAILGQDEFNDEEVFVDFDGDGNVDLFLLQTAFSQGEIIDADIIFNPDAVPLLRAWPENEDDLFANEEQLVHGSLDIQMVLTTQIGFAMGLGTSDLFDTVMFPFFDNRESPYPTDPYKKREPALDDKLTLGLVYGGDAGAGSSTISGLVLDGSRIDSTFDAEVDEDEGTVTLTEDIGDDVIVQAPVFLAVKEDQLVYSAALAGGFPEDVLPGFFHPDNVESLPFQSTGTHGTYRLIAHTLSGRNLKIPAGIVGDFDEVLFPLPELDEDLQEEPPGESDLELGDDDFVLEEVSDLNSIYSFPGLPHVDDMGNPINYAVVLGDDDLLLLDSEFMTPVQEFFADIDEYVTEYYGGQGSQIRVGDGTAPEANILNDNFFENSYITAEVNSNGRLAAAINDGPTVLSGFRSGPTSFFEVTVNNSARFSNRITDIGAEIDPLVINDLAESATATWLQNNNFSVGAAWNITQDGGFSGIPAGILVSYTLRNESSSTQSFDFRQVIDTELFARENPVYSVNDVILDREMTLSSDAIPDEIEFQTSAASPAFSGFVTLREGSFIPPDIVTIGMLSGLDRVHPPAGGLSLRGPNALNQDTGIALRWEDLVLMPQSSVTLRFIVGFLPPGTLVDTWLPFGDDGTAEDLENPEVDDEQFVTAIQLDFGETNDSIDIISNTGTSDDEEGLNIGVTPGGPGGQLIFQRQDGAFPDTDFIAAGGAIGDIDMDGDLDVVIANFGGGEDPVSNRINRVYENRQRVNLNGSVTYFYQDVTFGADGIPSTSDDRWQSPSGSPLPLTEESLDIVLADFDGDSDLDIFITQQNAPNRLYENLGTPSESGNHGQIGFFRDRSEDVLPGLLNGGWGESLGRPFRAAAGDIDSDGDIDLIISQQFPFGDSFGTSAFIDIHVDDENLADGLMDSAVDWFTDQLSYAERVLINQVNQPNYTPDTYLRGFYFRDDTLGADDRTGTLTSLQVTFSGPQSNQSTLSWDPAELDRMPPVFPHLFNLTSFSSADENATVEIAGMIASPMGLGAREPILAPMSIDSGLDLASARNFRFARGFFAAIPLSDTNVPEGLPDDVTFVPFGTFFGGDSLDHGAESAYFANVDIFSQDVNFDVTPENSDAPVGGNDGIPDGYFVCINYNNDFGVAHRGFPPSLDIRTPRFTAHGMFAIEPDPSDLAFRRDANPLFIGIPEGHDPDYEFTPGDSIDREDDIAARVDRSSWGITVADWTNAGRPSPFNTGYSPADTDFEEGSEGVSDEAPPFIERLLEPEFFFSGATYNTVTGLGLMRGIDEDEDLVAPAPTGIANSYLGTTDGLPLGLPSFYSPYIDEVVRLLAVGGGDEENFTKKWSEDPLRLYTGAPHDVTSGDFDLDGDMDVFVAYTTTFGIITEGGFIVPLGTPSRNHVFINDSLGDLTDGSASLQPNPESVSLATISGDVDLDGDIDLIVFNAVQETELYLNDVLNGPPDLFDDEDPKMLIDAGLEVIPPVAAVFIAPPDDLASFFTGLTVRTTVGDVNNDGFPDLLSAEGGVFSQNGDLAKLLINHSHGTRTSHNVEAVRAFVPGGSSYPAPYVDIWGHNFDLDVFRASITSVNGYLGTRSFMTDIAFCDVDLDRDNDIVIAKRVLSGSGQGPEVLINQDTDFEHLNSVPDNDLLGDASFDTSVGVPDIVTAGIPSPQGLNPKKQNSRLIMADLDNNGTPDMFLANGQLLGTGAQEGEGEGQQTGAPNALLFNSAGNPGQFTDVTESNLPPRLGGATTRNDYIDDNTRDAVAADLTQDGSVDIILANQSGSLAPQGFRFLINDGSGSFTDGPVGDGPDDRIPDYIGTVPASIMLLDVDLVGEITEDLNHNGILDLDEEEFILEDGLISYIDRPTETEDVNGNGVLDSEDLNCNGVLDEGEDVNENGLLDSEDGIIELNCELDEIDFNNDGVITYRENGVWEGSLDLFVAFNNDIDRILVNDPTNRRPGFFKDETSLRFPENLFDTPSRGATHGNLNGPVLIRPEDENGPEILIAQFQGGVIPYFELMHWTIEIVSDGTIRRGIYRNITNEVQNPNSIARGSEIGNDFEDPESFSGWAFDVDLIDYDLDGDLDVHVSCTANGAGQAGVSARNMFYVNRFIPNGLNVPLMPNLQSPEKNPLVLNLNPRGSTRDTVMTVEVMGANFQPGVNLLFGEGIDVMNVTFDKSTKVMVEISVKPDAVIGPRKIVAHNTSGGATITKNGMFNIYAGLENPIHNSIQDPIWMLME
jgi:hypothetical protein